MDLLWPQASIPPKLDMGDAHIWAVLIDDFSSQKLELRKMLSAEEQFRADQFRFEELSRRFIATRAALRTLLSQYLEVPPTSIQFSFDAHNKPRIVPNHHSIDLRFNLSHSGVLALIAVTIGNEIGVDVETRREVRHVEQIASRYFHRAEAAAVATTSASERNDAFLRCWTAKESVLKACGVGITHSLDAIEVPLVESFAGWVDLSSVEGSVSDSRCWLARLAPHRGFFAAVATMNAAPRLLCHALVI